ncbi:MAG TPA: DUF3110 domain-containing protein [Synechococcales bacterium UBA12195]|nr:DUF3110 domain-containing protein [Cyanobacteriota bacterium]RCL63365.1 MAG: DUF3110 domain-containing protein [Synechococcus sp. MED-G67]HCA61622.1 DUF3110 domain-containing protein [Synechococcales bacterium UBA8647]HCV57648.1 DUF3110 domain-containing protein [Synechococcales bacterium UBA12195]
MSDRVFVLLFDSGSEVEGIHTLELNGRTVVLMFEEEDDALRYAGLLAAQDFPEATPEAISREEIELFCGQAGYEAQSVPSGFMPGTAEERLMLAPPEQNLDTNEWREQQDQPQQAPAETAQPAVNPELEAFRRSLEGLL